VTSGKLFFSVLAIAYLALIGAALAPIFLGPVASTVRGLICSKYACPTGWLGQVVRYKAPNASEAAHKNGNHRKTRVRLCFKFSRRSQRFLFRCHQAIIHSLLGWEIVYAKEAKTSWLE
jgi:hypothetical protein